jgi:hypothetical protein
MCVTPWTLKPLWGVCCWGDPESFSHEHYPSSPTKTLRATMVCSVLFAGHPGPTKERRTERLAGKHAPRAEKPKKSPPG